MDTAVQIITLPRLALAFLPVLLVAGILYQWSLRGGTTLYALARMLLQLLAIGYFLTWIFDSDQPWVVALVLSVMLAVAAWIALRPLAERDRGLYTRSIVAIALGGIPTLLLVTQFVVVVDPWYSPRQVIPLAGMIFASAMNTVSLAAERFIAERLLGADYDAARRTAYHAALIPQLNSMFAVGLVSLPGMMTGQILSGVSPMLAVRYQIMVMCMLLGASGIAAACYLLLSGPGKSPQMLTPEP